jgi:hypothetical protein
MLGESSDAPDFVGDILQMTLSSCQGLLECLVMTEVRFILDWCQRRWWLPRLRSLVVIAGHCEDKCMWSVLRYKEVLSSADTVQVLLLLTTLQHKVACCH